MICKECGAYNSDRARFCKVCGASLLAEKEPVSEYPVLEEAEDVSPVEPALEDEFSEEPEAVHEKESATTRFSKKNVSSYAEEDDEDDEDYEDDEPAVPAKKVKKPVPRKTVEDFDDEDDFDDDEDDEEEYEEIEEEEEKPARRGLFGGRSSKASSKKKPKKYDEDDDDHYEEDEEDDEDDDEDEDEDDVKPYASSKAAKVSRAASKKAVKKYDDDDEDDEEDEDDDDYEEYESTPPRSKKKSSGSGSGLLVILLAVIAVILVLLIGLVVFCNVNADYRDKLPSFLQFSACDPSGDAPAVTDPSQAPAEEVPEVTEPEAEPFTEPEADEPAVEPEQEYTVEEIDYSSASLEETVNADGVDCIKVKFYLLPGETMTAVLPNQDDMVYKNENENYLDIALEIPKDCYKPNAPLDSAEYVVTPVINITAADGTVSSRDVGTFTMTFPEAFLEITEPAVIPEEGVMCPEGNVLHILGRTNDHTVTVMADDQKLNVYAGGEINADYVLYGEEAKDVTITVSGDNMVSTSKTITVLPYVFIPEPMELTAEGTAIDHKANLKSGKYTLTGKVTPGSEVTANCDYEDIKCGSVLVNADGSYSMDVTFGASTYGMFAIHLHATQEGYAEGDIDTYVYRMFTDRKAFVSGYQKTRNYYEMPAKVSFDKLLEEPGAYGGYRLTGTVDEVTEAEDGLQLVRMSVLINSKKETKTVYVLNMDSGWDANKDIGKKYNIYCTLNGMYDEENLSVIGWAKIAAK